MKKKIRNRVSVDIAQWQGVCEKQGVNGFLYFANRILMVSCVLQTQC